MPAATTTVAIFVARGRTFRLVTSRPVRHGGRIRIAAVGLPAGDIRVRLTAYDDGRLLGSDTVGHLYGLPAHALRVVPARRTVAHAQRRLRRLGGAGVTAVWLRDLSTGRAASYNAGARFTAASTLKLAILMTSLARTAGDPTRRSLWSSYQRLVVDSDNAAANAVEVAMGGSTSGGSDLVNRFCRAVGCRDTVVYGGYTIDTAAVRKRRRRDVPPVRIDRRPPIPLPGKYTTAHDLGVLLSTLVDAAAGSGRARREGITTREARVALWLLIHARYPGVIRPNVSAPVGHKAGWLGAVEHDAALIFGRHGTTVAIVMSQGGGVGLGVTGRYAKAVLHLALPDLSP